MHYTEMYKNKRTSMAEIVKEVKSGDHIYVHPGGAAPLDMLHAFAQYAKDNLEDVTSTHILTLGPLDYMDPALEGHVRHCAWFAGGNSRAAINEGRADWVPVFLGECPKLVYEKKVEFDVVLIQVCPPDEHGFCSLGVGVDITLAAVRMGKKVIAEVNPRQPRSLGDAFIHLSKIHKLVEVEHELAELPSGEISAVHEQCGAHIADIIGDGDCLQMGIGAIPDAVWAKIADRRNLGIHTEMFSDGAIDLLEKGVINGEVKNLHQGKIVASFVLGSTRCYDYLHNNPLIEMHPTEYCNNPFIIAQNDNMVAINSCLQIDLTGQVVSDNMGSRVYSGFGGQVDFIRGAAASKGGRPIIAFPSTGKGGKLSRIVGEHPQGYGVTTSRADVHWIATEYGIVDLWGMNRKRRAKALIELAHPDFRTELQEEAIRLGLI
ncbi:acetyl-CoA hydrolase/transferase family protein [bacterium]|nr:acetyl-CoA hydrolase/transferase family protein [bacterium]